MRKCQYKCEKSTNYKRKESTKPYRPVFVISPEGGTEVEYFQMLKRDNEDLFINILHNKSSDPLNVLKNLKKELKKPNWRSSRKSQSRDQAWVVIDRDNWSDGQIEPLLKWSQTNKQYRFALSNPNFEYWLLLHFEDPPGINSPRDCLRRLKKYLPNYKKHIDENKFSSHVKDAVKRAKKQTPPGVDWPRTTGTTVYRLVEQLIRTN